MFFSRPRKLYNTSVHEFVLVRARQLAVGDVLSTGETVTNVTIYATLDYVHVQLDKSNDLTEYSENVLVKIKR